MQRHCAAKTGADEQFVRKCGGRRRRAAPASLLQIQAMPRGNVAAAAAGAGQRQRTLFSHGFSVSASSRTGIASTPGAGPPPPRNDGGDNSGTGGRAVAMDAASRRRRPDQRRVASARPEEEEEEEEEEDESDEDKEKLRQPARQ